MNWREIAKICEEISPRISGAVVERVIVPERRDFPAGFLKGEWILRLHSRGAGRPEYRDAALIFSVWPQRAYCGLLTGRGPAATTAGTRAAFDLALGKYLAGVKIVSLTALPGERTIRLRFPGYSLFISLIPAHPEAYLVNDPGSDAGIPAEGFTVIAHSRGEGGEARYHPLATAKSPPDLALKLGISDSLANWMDFLDAELQREALSQRLQILGTTLRAQGKHAELRLRQNRKTLSQAEGEPEWAHFGDLLKSVMGAPPPPSAEGGRRVFDWTTEAEIEIPGDPQLSLRDQVAKYYANARRKSRRIEEARGRIASLEAKSERFRRSLAEWAELTPAATAAAGLGELRRGIVALESRHTAIAPQTAAADRKAIFGWEGKVFQSLENLPILVGKTKIENLELSFKVLRGNDLWFHVRGRPGAHAGVLLRSKAHASLETLLDAATLTLYYSGGEKWGKTEVDYTRKKNVKRIKDSSEASYTQNKTLLLEVDPVRLKRLLAQLETS